MFKSGSNPYEVGDEVLVDGKVVRIQEIEPKGIRYTIKKGRRRVFRMSGHQQVAPVGIDEPHGSGRGELWGQVASGQDFLEDQMEPRLVDFTELFAGGATYRSTTGRDWTVETRKVGDLSIESSLAAFDPTLPALASSFSAPIPQGRYEVRIGRAIRDGDYGSSIAAARLLLAPGRVPTHWELAAFEDGEPAYPVDSGWGCFADREALDERGVTSELYQKVTRFRYPFAVKTEGRTVAVAFPSGYGDGGYVSYLGSDGEGPVALVTDFGVLYESTQLTMRFEGVRGLRRGALRHSLIDDANIDVTFENFASRLELHFEGRGDPNDSLPFKPDGIPWLIDDNGRHGKRARSPGTSANTEHFSLDLWSTVADDAVLEITLSCGRIPLSCR